MFSMQHSQGLCSPMRKKKWKKVYTKIAGEIAEELKKHAESTNRHINRRKLKIIVELGSGSGKLASEILEIIKNEILLFAVDINIPKNIKRNERIFFIRGDAKKLMFKKAKIDAFYSNFFVSWLGKEELGKVFSEAYEALREYGVFIVSDFIGEETSEHAKKVAIEQGKPENNLMPTTWHGIAEIAKEMEKTGFKEISYRRFSHSIKFSYSEAVEQLCLWHAKQEFINKVKPMLKQYGMKLPDSYIIKGVKK